MTIIHLVYILCVLLFQCGTTIESDYIKRLILLSVMQLCGKNCSIECKNNEKSPFK